MRKGSLDDNDNTKSMTMSGNVNERDLLSFKRRIDGSLQHETEQEDAKRK